MKLGREGRWEGVGERRGEKGERGGGRRKGRSTKSEKECVEDLERGGPLWRQRCKFQGLKKGLEWMDTGFQILARK